MTEIENAANQISLEKSTKRKYQKRDSCGQGPETGGSDSLLNPTQSQKEKVKVFKALVAYARKHRISKVKFGEIEFELTGHSFLSRKELREVKKVFSPSPEQQRAQYEDDLYYSSL